MFEIIFDPYNYPFWVLVISVIAGAVLIISRPFSTYLKFVYPNAKFEAMGNPFVSENELSRMLDSKSLSGFKELLNTSKDYNINGENTYDVQQSLDDAFIQTVEMMQKDSSKKMKDFYDVYLEKIDIHLIKNELKNRLEGKKSDETVINQAVLVNTKKLLQKIMETEKEDLPEILKSYGFGEEVTHVLSDKNVDFLTIDNVMDTHIINRFKRVKVPYKCEQAKQKFVKNMIDIRNIKNILRAKQLDYAKESYEKLFLGAGQEIASWKFKEMADVDEISQVISSLEGTSYYGVLKDAIERYNKEGSVQVLENALDGLFLKLVADISTQNYVSIGPTIRFIVSKEFEIRNLKIIAKGIGENLPSEMIKSYLTWEAR